MKTNLTVKNLLRVFTVSNNILSQFAGNKTRGRMGPKSIHKVIAKHARFVWLDNNNNNGGWDTMI